MALNSYVTTEEADDYFETRLDSGEWFNADEDDREAALSTASMIVDQNQFIGVAVSSTQNLAWPRKGVTFFDPKLSMNIRVEENEVPFRVKQAVFETALHLLENEFLLRSGEQTFEKIKVGPIEIADSSSNFNKPSPTPNLALTILRPLLTQRRSSNSWWRAN